jgi:hypothetical protein
MALTQEQLARKAFKVSGSMMPILMDGDDEKILKLYREEIGESEREPPSYAMRLGSMIEPFLLDYHQEQIKSPITRRGEVVDHPTIKDFCVTLDGYSAELDAIIESKFLSPFYDKAEFYPHYYPQCLSQMRTIGAARGFLLAGRGTSEPTAYKIVEPTVEYEAEMWRRAEAFRMCLRTFTPPSPMKRAVPPEMWRSVDLTRGEIPNWGAPMKDLLALYEETRAAADQHKAAGDDARKLVPDDVSLVLAGTHKISRNKNGALSIRRVA